MFEWIWVIRRETNQGPVHKRFVVRLGQYFDKCAVAGKLTVAVKQFVEYTVEMIHRSVVT